MTRRQIGTADAPFQFDAVLEEGARGGALVAFPGSTEEAFGTRARVAIPATFDGASYRGSLMPMGGRHILGVRKDIRAAIGKDVGDTVAVRLWRDEEPRTVDVPDDLAAALRAAPGAQERFFALSYTHQREAVEGIVEAKRAETRARRIRKTVERALEGKSR